MSKAPDVTPELTRKVAGLARLSLTEDEVTRFTEQFKQVLGYVGQLQSVDTTGVPAMTHALETPLPMREDVARDYPRGVDGSPKVLGPAPETLHDGFKVPPIL